MILRLRVRDATHEAFMEDQEDEANDDCDSINSVYSEDENENDVLASGGSYDNSIDITFAVIGDEDETGHATTTRSGQVINRRAEIDFFHF